MFTTIYKVSLQLTQKSYYIKIYEINATETKNSYLFHDGYSNRRLKKSEFTEINSMTRNAIVGSEMDYLTLFCYCKEESEIKRTIEKMSKRLNEVFLSINKSFSALKVSINSEPKIIRDKKSGELTTS